MTQFEDKQFSGKGALLPFLKRIFTYAWVYKKWMYQFLFWIGIVAITEAIFPLILLGFLDYVIQPELQAIQAAQLQGTTHAINYVEMLKYTGVFMVIGLIQVIGVYIFIKYAGRVQEHVMFDLREKMFNKLQRLSFSYYDRSASGWLLTRLTSDTDRVAEVISWGLLDAFWGVTNIVFCLLALFYFNLKLGLIVMISIPVMLVASIKVRMLVLEYSRTSRKLNSELTASFSEHINGVKVIKSTGQEQEAFTGFKGLSGKMRRASYKAGFFTAMYIPIVLLIGSLAAALVVFFGGQMAIAVPAGITIGVLAASFDYAMKIFLPIMDISMFYARAQGSLSAGERIFSLLNEEVTIKDQVDALSMNRIQGDIKFEGVEFYYKKENPVLENFNLRIKAGESIALVGATGEGKSTIINLICRFYEPTNGTLKIDGKDYTQSTLKSLRSQMGIVLQTPHLFSGTMRENIVYGRQEATDKEVKEALQIAGASHFESRLNEEVGEGGDQLSQGEKQLVSFARAVLTKPRIFIMDEATSSVDTLTEARIQEGIGKILEGRTSLIIAHRLSTIKNCDRILVIKKGGIVEDGNHEDLMNKKGRYYDLYTRQLREEKAILI